MSQSDSDVSVDTSSTIDIAQRRSGLTPSGSRAITPYTYVTSARDYFQQPQTSSRQQQTLLPRHYATIQEHADSIMRTEYANNEALTPPQEGRRGSFAWVLRTVQEDLAPKHSRNPMIPQQPGDHAPLTREEISRKNKHDEDSSSTRKSSVIKCETVLGCPSAARPSTAGTDINTMSRLDTGNSVGGLEKNMTKMIPDIKSHRATHKSTESMSTLDYRHSKSVPSSQGNRRGRKLSFQLPSDLEAKIPVEEPRRTSPVVEEVPSCESPSKNTSPDATPKCSGLAARRQVKMDITLPPGLPGLSNRGVSQEANSVIISSITPSRPRSPRRPWVRESEGVCDRGSKLAVKTARAVEDDEDIGPLDMITLNDAGVEFRIESALPPPRPLLEESVSVRPPPKLRDRCYISRPTTKRSTSRGFSTSDSDFGSTPDGYWTLDVSEGMSEQEARAQKELAQLAKTSKSVRSRRWPWNKSKTSGSDEQTVTQGRNERHDNRESTSVSIFKRSDRLAEKKREKDFKPPKEWIAPWKRDKPADKPPLPSASLANMIVPPAFIPPGCEKVPTPPTFDEAGEVRGKLADFFFDSHGLLSTRRKNRASPGGYWDSDAVLMSMTADLRLSNTDEEEEGPEGRPTVTTPTLDFAPPNDTPGPMMSPGLYTSRDGYLGVEHSSGGARKAPISPGQDSWFRMHFGDLTPDVESLTASALKEADERRKFEWLVPEHLPNSPLCPLHVKYVGPSKGLCYWHGRKSNGWGIEPGRDYIIHPVRIGEGSSAGWDVGWQENPREVTKKRRLQSLSSP